MLLVVSEDSLGHQTPAGHPESPARFIEARRVLAERRLLDDDRRLRVKRPTFDFARAAEAIAAVHGAEALEKLRRASQSGGEYLDADTYVSTGSYQAGVAAATAAIEAADEVASGGERRAFCLVRPPGHHAESKRVMGFCLFNSIACAARYLLDRREFERILIVDWDVHHGNGTQEIFYGDPRVMFFSIHRYPFYPWSSGAGDETGTGAGLGFNRNAPIKFGATRTEYLNALQSGLEAATKAIKPQIVFASCGFDPYRLDPIGGLGLELEDFQTIGQVVLDVARTYADGRYVGVLEGGYHLDGLARGVADHVQLLQDAPD